MDTTNTFDENLYEAAHTILSKHKIEILLYKKDGHISFDDFIFTICDKLRKYDTIKYTCVSDLVNDNRQEANDIARQYIFDNMDDLTNIIADIDCLCKSMGAYLLSNDYLGLLTYANTLILSKIVMWVLNDLDIL